MTEPTLLEVEEFLSTCELDLAAADELRFCSGEVKAAVIEAGPLDASWNPSEELLARIRAASDGQSGNLSIEGASEEAPSVEDFLAETGVDERAQEELRAQPVEVQTLVMARGDLSTARNPSAALLARIRDAKKSSSAPPAAAAVEVDPDAIALEVEDFIASNGIDERASTALQECTPEVQQVVLARGDLSDARNPSAALLARIRDAQKGAGAAAGAQVAASKGGYGGGGKGGAAYAAASSPAARRAAYGTGGGGALGPPPSYGGNAAPAGGAYAASVATRRASYGRPAAQEEPTPAYGRAAYGQAGGGMYGKGGAVPVRARTDGYGGGGSGMVGYAGKGGAAAGGYGAAVRAGYGYGAAAVPAAGRRGYGAAAPAAPKHDPWANDASDGGEGKCLFLTVDSLSQLVQSGFPEEAPAVEWDKNVAAFGSSTWILGEVVSDYTESCAFEMDHDWDIYPEVAEAWKQAGGEENCYMVAKCENLGKWAVGVASGKKNAERAARLALAVAVANGTPEMGKLVNTYPEFREFCRTAGLLKGATQSMKPKKRVAAQYNPEDVPAVASAGGDGPQVVWLTLGQESQIVTEGLPENGPAIAFSKAHSSSFSNANNILSELVEDIQSEVALHHDPDWKDFPEVAEAMKAAGAEENCFAVGTCSTSAKWAVGIGGNWKSRENATKLALSVAIASSDPGKIEELAVNYPEFGELCAQCGLVEAAPARKRARY